MTLILMMAGALGAMIVGYASDYYTVKIYYQFEDGTSAHDTYIAVFEKDSVMDRTVKSPIIQGYQPYDSTDDDAQIVTEVHLQGQITGDQTMTFYYKPEMVPYKVNYFLQNINDDNFTAMLTLPESYYQKTGLTGTFPEDLEDFSDDPHFSGFTKLYHKPDFIAADGSTEFEIYFSRDYNLIGFLLDGGYGTESVYAKYGSTYNVAEPVKEGYVFQGWIECDNSGTPLDPDAAPEKFTNRTVLDKDQYFKAVWEAELVNYSYVYLFETVDGSGVTDVDGKNYAVIGAKDVVKQKYSGETVSAVDNFYEGIDTQGLTINDMNSKIVPRFQSVYDDMSAGEIEQLWNKNRFTFNEAVSSKNVVVKGDGTTRVYVYYDRKVYKQRFFFYRENVNEPDETKKYEIAGYTKAFSMTDTSDLSPEEGLHKHLQWKSNKGVVDRAVTDWMQIIEQRPTVWPEYLNRANNKVVVKRYPETGSLHDSSNGNDYAYYYWEFDTKYYENMHETWLQHALAPVPVKESYKQGNITHDYKNHAAGFGAWSVEWNAYYPDGKWADHAVNTSNRTCKGIYETLDEQLNAVGEIDEDFAYLTPENKEIVYPDVDIRGCTAEANPDYGNKYKFLGWYDVEYPGSGDVPLSTDAFYRPPRPEQTTYYYAVFKMNYTVNYVYQGRRSGNDGSYIGDDEETDEKVYTVFLDLMPEDLEENGMPLPRHLVEKAPAVDDLYKDCVWTIDDEHVTFNKSTLTVTITAVQTPRKCLVEFYYGDYKEKPDTVGRVPLNSLVIRNGAFIEAPAKEGDNPFAYWSVKEKNTGKEIAKCFSREFNFRVTDDVTVTACYTAEAVNVLSISDPEFTREQYTDENGEVKKDILYADFILAYMNRENMILLKDSAYKTGLIIEFDRNIVLTKKDSPGAVLGDDEKVVYPDNTLLSEETLKEFAAGDKTSDLKNDNTRALYKYSVNNSSYNNKNRVDKAVKFNNTENFRHYVFRAYYYVIDDKGNTELSDPVYFYLYDIGNSVSQTLSAGE